MTLAPRSRDRSKRFPPRSSTTKRHDKALPDARRAYHIPTPALSPTLPRHFTRTTITCTGPPETLEQINKQLAKLIDVVHAIDHTGDDSYETEIALVKLESKLDQRTEILQIAEHYGAKVVDYASDSLMLRVYGDSDKLDAFIALLGPYGLSELVRSGKILMARGLAET